MALVKIPCEQFGSTRVYELDTKLFNENIFKMCTQCGIFSHDFAEMFCECGHKLDYVDLSDIEALRSWLHNEVWSHRLVDSITKLTCTTPLKIEVENDLMTDTHTCNNGDDCSNVDCIDCSEHTWEKFDEYEDYDAGFYSTYHEDECEDECEDDSWEDNDSVS